MKEMTCKLCGYRGGAEESQCPDCGAPLFEAPLDIPAETAPVSDEVDITKKYWAWPRLTRPALAAGFLALCLAVQGVGLWRLHRPVDPGWSFADIQSDRLVTSQGVWSFGDVEVGGAGSNDGPCRVIWTWNRNYDGSSVDLGVYFYDGKSLEKTDWNGATVSGNGQALFYQTGDVDGEQTITRRDLKTGRETEVARGLGLSVSSNCDYAGTALAYYLNDTTHGDQAIGVQGYLWQLGAGSRELEGYPHYLGKHGDNYLVTFPAQGEDPDQFYFGSTDAVVWNNGERMTTVNYNMRSDRELTEILYQDDQGWWTYENQEGLTKRLEDLPQHAELEAVRSSGDGGGYYGYGPAHLTDQVYRTNGVLYYLDEDLSVTRLTPMGTAGQARRTADGQTLYCVFRPSGESPAFWQLERTASGDWEQSRALDNHNVEDYVLSPDGQTLCVRCWDGKSLVWKVRVGQGDWQTLDNVWAHAATGDILPMNGGGCWYQGDSSTLHKELWYRSPEGETQLKMAYTSPASSTMYPTDTQAEVETMLLGLDSFELIDLGRGDQALLRVGYAPSDGTKYKFIYSGAYAPDREEAEYWLLEADGTMTKLEAIEP